MGYESCANKYSHFFSPRLKKIFEQAEWSIPQILNILNEHCEDEECTHHVSAIINMYRPPNSNAMPDRKLMDVPWVKRCHRCMCLIDSQLTVRDIADAIGIGRQTVQNEHESALNHLRSIIEKLNVEGGDINESPFDDVGYRLSF